MDTFLKRLRPSRLRTWLTWNFPEARDIFESYIATDHIDWNVTKAFSDWKMVPSIWINLKGVRPNGIVGRGAEYEDLLAFIIKMLYEIKDPETGAQLIARVYRKEEIYSGAYPHIAPDLVIDKWVNLGFQPGRSEGKHRGWPIITSERPRGKGSREKTGDHRYNGIVLLKGKPFKTGQSIAGAQIIDLAPTILYLMGLPVPDDMDGRVLTEALKDEYLARHPVTIRQADNGDSMSDRVYFDEDARKVEERLKSLGYLD